MSTLATALFNCDIFMSLVWFTQVILSSNRIVIMMHVYSEPLDFMPYLLAINERIGRFLMFEKPAFDEKIYESCHKKIEGYEVLTRKVPEVMLFTAEGFTLHVTTCTAEQLLSSLWYIPQLNDLRDEICDGILRPIGVFRIGEHILVHVFDE